MSQQDHVPAAARKQGNDLAGEQRHEEARRDAEAGGPGDGGPDRRVKAVKVLCAEAESGQRLKSLEKTEDCQRSHGGHPRHSAHGRDRRVSVGAGLLIDQGDGQAGQKLEDQSGYADFQDFGQKPPLRVKPFDAEGENTSFAQDIAYVDQGGDTLGDGGSRGGAGDAHAKDADEEGVEAYVENRAGDQGTHGSLWRALACDDIVHRNIEHVEYRRGDVDPAISGRAGQNGGCGAQQSQNRPEKQGCREDQERSG